MTDAEHLLSAGFDPNGAYGPMIVVQLASEAAVASLRQLILAVAAGLEEPELSDLAEVRLVNLDGLRLTLALSDPTRSGGRWSKRGRELVRLDDGSAFVWSCSRERRRTNAALVDPFIAGRMGHQYMTSEKIDDALIEVSFGESHPGL